MKLYLKRHALLLWHSIRMYRLPISSRLRLSGRTTRRESWKQSRSAAYQKLRSQGRFGAQIDTLDPEIHQWLKDAGVIK